jgi:AraC-like DNA-binding protein
LIDQSHFDDDAMTLSFDIYTEQLGLAAGLGISLFVLIGLIRRLFEPVERRMHIWAMMAFFAINALDMLDSILFDGPFTGPAALYQWQDVLIPGFMVSLYFFVRGLTSSDPRLRQTDWVHVLPFAFALLCLAPSLALPGQMRIGLDALNIGLPQQRLIAFGENAFWILWILVLILYGGICIRRLIRHKRVIRDLFSDLTGKTLRWLDGLVATILLLALIVIVDEILILSGLPKLRSGMVGVAFDLVLAIAFGVFALRANPPLPRWSKDIKTDQKTQIPKPEQPQEAGASYARSGLQAEDLDRYAKRLDARMSKDQLWRDHDLNLRSLAAAIAVPPIHLSEVLNSHLGLSFYDYVNQFRIKDACDLLAEPGLSILEISETVGFNAKSTFNASFRKVTGQTPSEWRRRHL